MQMDRRRLWQNDLLLSLCLRYLKKRKKWIIHRQLTAIGFVKVLSIQKQFDFMRTQFPLGDITRNVSQSEITKTNHRYD